MKKIFVFTLITMLSITSISFAQDNQANRYAIKSGHVEYKLTGNTEGTKSLWFDNYGEIFVEEVNSITTTKMFGMKNVTEEHKVTIMKGAENITIDYIEETVYKSTNPYYQDGKDFAESMTKEEQEEFTNSIMNSFGGEIIGEENILGKKCEIMSMLGTKTWIYKGVALKSEAKILGVKNFEDATEFEENVKIPASKFKIPEGFEVEDLTQQIEAYYGDYDDGYEEEEDEESYPVEMPYNIFLDAIDGLQIEGYNSTTTMNMEGEQYMAVYMKTFTQAFTIVASSMEDADMEADEEIIESFKHKGRDMHYITTTEDGITMNGIVVEFPKYNTFISLIATGEFSKDRLVDIFDDLKF